MTSSICYTKTYISKLTEAIFGAIFIVTYAVDTFSRADKSYEKWKDRLEKKKGIRHSSVIITELIRQVDGIFWVRVWLCFNEHTLEAVPWNFDLEKISFKWNIYLYKMFHSYLIIQNKNITVLMSWKGVLRFCIDSISYPRKISK